MKDMIGYTEEATLANHLVAVISKGSAVHVFDFKVFVKDADGRALIKENGVMTIVYVLRDGEWMVLRCHNSYEKESLQKNEKDAA